MKFLRYGVISLACVGGAIACGVVANAAIDLVMPPVKPVVVEVSSEPGEQPAAFALAAATSTPTEIEPARVKTILIREEPLAEPPAQRAANVPLPRPRPASAPGGAMAMDATASIARQPGSMAISAATRKASPDDGDMLSAAGIDRMRTALALTAEQEEFWPAIAAELRTIGKILKSAKARNGKLDEDAIQRLYWAAAPLISRLSHEQKLKVKQMAHVMGLNQVAEAL